MSKVPIILRNKTRWPLVFRYKSPHHLAFHKVSEGDNPKTLEPGGVLMVDTDPGATWEASIPSSDYVYGSQFVQPYKFMGVNVPTNVQQGQIFDISEALFVNRDPAPGGMTGTMTGAHPTQVVSTGFKVATPWNPPGPDDESLQAKIKAHPSAVWFAAGSVGALIILCVLYWLWTKGKL